MRKTILVSGLSVAMVLSLAGCGQSGAQSNQSNAATGQNSSAGSNSSSSNSSSSNSATSSGQKVALSFTWWGDPIRNKVYDGVIAAFEKKYPNIVVQAQPTSWADYWTKLSTEIAGGNAPDIVGMHQFYVSDYANRGSLTDLEPYVKSGVINLSDFPKSVANSGDVNGKLVMVAQGVTMSGQIYNEALLKQLGVSDPPNDWTWTQFTQEVTNVESAFKSKGEAQKHWAVDDESSLWDPVFQYYVRQHGEDLYNSQGKLGFSLKTLESWFTYWENLRKQGIIPDAATAAQYMNASVEKSTFTEGKVAITAIPANQLYLYQEQFKNSTVGLVGEPAGANSGGEFVEGAYLAVPSSSKHPKEAAEFINFFVNDTNAGKIFKLEQGVPGSSKVDQAINPLLTPTQQTEVKFIQSKLKMASTAVYPPKGNTQIQTDFVNTAQAIAYGKESVDQASKQFMQEANSVLG